MIITLQKLKEMEGDIGWGCEVNFKHDESGLFLHSIAKHPRTGIEYNTRRKISPAGLHTKTGLSNFIKMFTAEAKSYLNRYFH